MAAKVLVVGGGGREHALAWKLAESPLVSTVFVAPGNAGTAREPRLRNVPIAADAIDELCRFAGEQQVDLTVIGPEAPLVAGIVDTFEAAGLPCLGPSARAAALEGSKAFTKDFLKRHGIPTAGYETFTSVEPALAYVRQGTFPTVIKADGLAAGKGVVIAENLGEAEAAIKDMLGGQAFGDAGRRIVIEEFMVGEEASFIVLADGEDVVAFATSQDHKRLLDGDLGPNTGGMGAYSPAAVVTTAVHQRVMHEIIHPTLRGMLADGRRYRGFLYAGLMIDADGAPRVVEFNCRFGDPETQPVMLRLQSDFYALCLAAVNGDLAAQRLTWDSRCALGVVVAAGGYPGTYAKGLPINGLDDSLADTKVFHAGTASNADAVVTAGGRVLCVCALGDTVVAAQQLAYERLAGITFEGAVYRRDIGYRAISRGE